MALPLALLKLQPVALLLAKTAAGLWLENEVRQLVIPSSVGTNTEKVPKVTIDPPSSNINVNNYNTQNNSYNYTRISNTNTNIYQNTNNINVIIPPLPTRNLPQTLTTGGSTNTALVVKNTVKKSLANRRYGSLLTNPFYEGEESITIYTDLTENTFLEAIEQQVYSYKPPVLGEGELPDALEVATAFLSFNDQGFAVPVFSLKIINQISSYYSSASKTSGFDVTGLINLSPITFENVGNSSTVANYPPLVTDFAGEATSRTLWDLLGYEETDFRQTSIKQIINDFSSKIYDDDGDLLEIGDNFETTEQFIAGAIATLFVSSDTLTPPQDQKLWDLLGYSEGAFKGKSIEDLIKDFRDKIYDGNSIKDIDDNFDNLEQLLVGVISAVFYREGLDRLPVDVEVDDNTTVTFKNNLEYFEYLLQSEETLKIWDLLGYEETAFKDKTIEDIIKDFLGKIYDANDQDKLLPIGENFEATEQFITGAIAALFYRLGLNKLPTGDDDNPINNLTDIVLILLGIMNLLKEEKEKKLWELLGYSENAFKGKSIEDLIKDFGEKIYQNKKVVSLNDNVLNNIDDNFETLEQLLMGIGASLFYRSGLHRLPSKLPESLSFDTEKYQNPNDQPSIFVEDMMEYQEYLIKNLDEIFGRFPINFDFKSKDQDGKLTTTKIKFQNIAECLLELSALAIDTEKTIDVQTSIALKTLKQTLTCTSAATLATDLGKTIIDFLGFDYEEFERKMKLPITPKAKTIKEFLEDSEGATLGIKKPIIETDLKTLINKVTVYSGIAAAAVGQKKSFITGDAIRDLVQEKKATVQTNYDNQWADLVDDYTGISVNTPRSKFPNAKVKDKSINKNSPPTP